MPPLIIIIDHTVHSFSKSRFNSRLSFGGFNPSVDRLNKKIKKGFHQKKKKKKRR